jgi:hypothetical protein
VFIFGVQKGWGLAIPFIQTRMFRRLAYVTAWVLVAHFLFARDSSGSKATAPKIRLDVTSTASAELDRDAKALGSSPNAGYRRLDHPETVADFVGGKVKDIRVVGFTGSRISRERIDPRILVRKVWAGEFQDAYGYQAWDEVTLWTVEAIVDFDDGKESELITDGMHVALQDHDGKSWFFRLLPAAQ